MEGVKRSLIFSGSLSTVVPYASEVTYILFRDYLHSASVALPRSRNVLNRNVSSRLYVGFTLANRGGVRNLKIQKCEKKIIKCY